MDIKIGSKADSCLDPNMRESKYGKLRYDGPPIIKPPEYKQEFLAGDKAAVMYLESTAPHVTNYSGIFRGLQQEDKAQPLDDGRTSFNFCTSPDPATMSRTHGNWNELNNDRMRLSRRMFAKSTTKNFFTPDSPREDSRFGGNKLQKVSLF